MSALVKTDSATASAGSPFGPIAALWRVDSDQSVARFSSATMWGRVPVSGRFNRLRGTLSWDGAGGHGRLAIATAGLSSGIKLRDHHLRSGAFFDVENHPELTFEASEVIVAGGAGHVQLRGDLFVRGRRHPFEGTATVEAVDDSRVVLEACAAFDLDALGMSRGMLRMIPARVTASVRVELKRALA